MYLFDVKSYKILTTISSNICTKILYKLLQASKLNSLKVDETFLCYTNCCTNAELPNFTLLFQLLFFNSASLFCVDNKYQLDIHHI